MAVYTGRLAVALPDRINVWEVAAKDEGGAAALAARVGAVGARAVDLGYRLRKDRIFAAAPPEKLLVAAQHILVGEGRKLAACAFECGDTRRREREWVFEAHVTCARVDGGPPGREGVLVGLANGKVLKVIYSYILLMEYSQSFDASSMRLSLS